MTFGSVLRQAFTNPCWEPATDLPDLCGKVALITGASAGLGKETALQLAKKGAHVFCLGRSADKTLQAIKEIKEQSSEAKVEFLQADLMDLKSVEKAADDFLARNLPLHILVNNAGIMAPPFGLSKDGMESQMATNHLAHVVLTNKLLPVLIKSQPSRIVVLSSLAHEFAPKEGIHYSELCDETKYDSWVRYSESKLANIHFAFELQKRLDAKLGADQTLFVNVVHPGSVNTELERNLDRPANQVLSAFFHFAAISPQKGALTQIFVSAASDIEQRQIKGKYFVPYCKEASPSPVALNEYLMKETWDWTERILQEKHRADWAWSTELA